MIQKTYTARMNRVRSMIKGLTTYRGQLEKYGANRKFLASLFTLKGNLIQTQEHRQTLKKYSIEATAAKNRDLKKAERLCSRARQWIRREFSPQSWPAFGFQKGEFSKEKSKGKMVKGKKR